MNLIRLILKGMMDSSALPIKFHLFLHIILRTSWVDREKYLHNKISTIISSG